MSLSKLVLILISILYLIQCKPKLNLPACASLTKDSQAPACINSIGMEFVKIKAGSFKMGCSDGDTSCYDFEKPGGKTVNITQDFYMSKYEVTQGQWKKVMNQNQSFYRGNCTLWFYCDSDQYPAETVSWNDITRKKSEKNLDGFIQRLNENEKRQATFIEYKLPTEAEWEYAARAGTNTPYIWGDSVPTGNIADEKVNFQNVWKGYNDGFKFTAPVGMYSANLNGLYDMTGNVWEWTDDGYDKDYHEKLINGLYDPTGNGQNKAIRGGSYGSAPDLVRVSIRADLDPDGQDSNIGFRLLFRLVQKGD